MSTPSPALTQSRWLAAIFTLALVLPLLAWISAVGNVLDYFSPSVPPGQALYVFSKLAGLVSLTLVALQGFLILGRRMRWSFIIEVWTLARHRALGLMIAAAVTTHAALFVGAASLRGGKPAWDVLTLRFFSTSYDRGLSLGATALWLILAALPVGALAYGGYRPRLLRPIHGLVIIALPLAIAHGLWIGSEQQLIVLLLVFLGVLVGSAAWLAKGWASADREE